MRYLRADEEPPGVVVLYNQTEQLVKGEARDILAEQGVVQCAGAVAEALGSAGHRVVLVPICGNVEAALAPYSPTEWVIFNLGEGLDGRLLEEVRIAWALEAMGYRFTGSDAEALAWSTHKARAKAILQAGGVATPAWWVFRDPREVGGAGEVLGFPLIVKPVAEDASLGIDLGAVVHDERALRERVGYVVRHYRQAALAEQFIAGREFNLSIWGDPPELLPMAEVKFDGISDLFEQIVSFAAKWQPESFAYWHTPVICPAQVSPELEARLRATVLRAWEVMGCRGYARVDLRVDAKGTPYVIEVNCNPDLSPDAGFFRAASTAGYDYVSMVTRILEFAMESEYLYEYHYSSKRGRRRADPRDRRQGWRVQTWRCGLRSGVVGELPAQR
ncbi:MAG: D-alanine--D-alanine ligase family protein [Anaerolineae bacterium]